MRPTIALIDTSFFANCLKLKHHGIDIFPALTMIVEYILVPIEIKNEVERFRPPETRPEEINNFLNDLELLETGFFRLCSTYDTMLLRELEALVDNGEAEVVAQAQKIGAHWIWIDNSRDVAKIERSYRHFTFHNIITIIYLLHYQGFLAYEIDKIMNVVQKIYNHPIQKRQAAELQAKQWLSL
jgi:predicted nucleic acid-binding protein